MVVNTCLFTYLYLSRSVGWHIGGQPLWFQDLAQGFIVMFLHSKHLSNFFQVCFERLSNLWHRSRSGLILKKFKQNRFCHILVTNVMGERWTGGASDIVKAKCSGEDPRATAGLVSNLFHPRVNKIKQHTMVTHSNVTGTTLFLFLFSKEMVRTKWNSAKHVTRIPLFLFSVLNPDRNGFNFHKAQIFEIRSCMSPLKDGEPERTPWKQNQRDMGFETWGPIFDLFFGSGTKFLFGSFSIPVSVQ